MKTPLAQRFHSPVNSAYNRLALALPPSATEPPRTVTWMLAVLTSTSANALVWRTGLTHLISGFPAFILFQATR